MREVTIEDAVQARTQALIEQQIGNLVLSTAKFRAQAEVYAELEQRRATAVAGGGATGAQGAEQRTGDQVG